jgi:hypothetical protein
VRYICIVLTAILSLSSCSTLIEEPIHTAWVVPFSSSDKNQYLESQNAPDLVVPPPLTTTNLSGFYRLPPAPQNPKVEMQPPVT